MSSLYRCHARVAYKPRKSKKLIVFEERQIDSITTSIAVNFSPAIQNQSQPLSSIYATNENTCSVTLNEPFLDGVTWQTLLDVDRFSSVSNLAAIDGVLLPQCEEGQDPDKDKCSKYSRLDDSENRDGGFPMIVVTLWYTLEGINQTNSVDLYFRAVGTSIKHGGGLDPQVTIRGRGLYDVILQENVSPKFFEKGESAVDELNKKALNFFNYEVEDVCSTPADEQKIERTYRINGLTTKELVHKLATTENGGQALSLPTKEFANKIQICSKADSSCYASRVFYLGKGLYEKYQISSEIPQSALERNISAGSTPPSLPGEPKVGDKVEYKFYQLDPETTSQKLDKVSSSAFLPFEKQFEDRSDYQTGDVTNGWKATATGKKLLVEKIEKKALFGDARSAVSYLGGTVLKINNDKKSVEIKTNYYIHLCEDKDDVNKKCFRMNVYEEYRNLVTISVKEGDVLEPNKLIGESSETPQTHSLFRYYSIASGGEVITLDPSSLKAIVSTSEGLKDSEKQDQAPSNNSSDGIFVGKVGSTGRSTGPHVHIQESTGSTLSESELFALAGKYVAVGGRSLTSYTKGDGFGAGRGHGGIDFPIEEGEDISVFGSIVASGPGVGGGACGNGVAFNPPEGPELLICHLQDDSIPADLSGNVTGTFSNSGRANPAGPNGAGVTKDGIKLKTEFKGIPKAFEILPGRTILSFISDYDSWITNNKSSDIDPGIWIPERYKNWQINQVTYEWENADLRVKIEGMRPWDAAGGKFKIDSVPNFGSYIAEMGYTDYYDYIRSSGDLCYKTPDGKNSCAEFCKKPAPSGANEPSGPNSVVGDFAPGPCQYTGTRFNRNSVNSLANAIQSGLGIRNKFGIAGILGNSGWESAGFNPKATGGGGERGLFQWNPAAGRLQELEAYSKNLGVDPLTIEAQVKFFVHEVNNRGYKSVISKMNNATSIEGAVADFEDIYEKAGVPALAGRNEIAGHIYDNMPCS